MGRPDFSLPGMWKIVTAKFSTSIKWAVCFFYLFAIDASATSLEITLEEYADKPFGNVIFLRHAFAPGMDANGQPAEFKIDDCSTQRNLDATGIAQCEWNQVRHYLFKPMVPLPGYCATSRSW